jgi:hypothetical protein
MKGSMAGKNETMNQHICRIEKKTLYLLSNGDLSPLADQGLYEDAWEEGIRPLNESRLKPRYHLRRCRRPAPADGFGM